jgi:diguanylate cyclase (GGDEF)-like protein
MSQLELSPEGKKSFEALKAADKLPSPNGVALKLMKLMQDSDVPVQEIISLLNTDPASTGRLLKLANSSVYGRVRPAVAITPDVIMSVGISAIRQVVLAFSLLASRRQARCPAFDYENYWARSLSRALICQHLAAEVGALQPSEMFTFGLLSNIGDLALASAYPQEYAEILKSGAVDSRKEYLERAAFGLTSTELTMAMLADWGFPEGFTVAVCDSDVARSKVPRSNRINCCLKLSNSLSNTLLGSDSGETLAEALATALPVADGLDLGHEQLFKITKGIHSEWEVWSKTFELAVRPLNTFTKSDIDDATSIAPEPLMVMVVDDEAAERASLEALILELGHKVTLAANWSECLALSQESRPDLYIIDGVMPEIDGFALVSTLRSTQGTENPYIIILTNPEDECQSAKAFEAGADDFMRKPIHKAILQPRLLSGGRALASRRNLTEERDRLRNDIEALSANHLEALEAALTDALTGLYNRRHATQRMTELWAQSSRSQQPVSVIVVDIDYFKRINDTYGHAVGDLALKNFAHVLRNHSRIPDMACRIGGEEFLLILPDTPAAGAKLHAERIRKACETSFFEASGQTLKMTASFGVAEKTHDMLGYEELLDAADQALLIAKQRGRNQVVVAGGYVLPSQHQGVAANAI